MAAKIETLSGSSDISSDDTSSNSDSTNSSAESDIENSDNDEDNVEIRTKKSRKDRKSFEKSSKNPAEEAKKYNQRYSLLIERINAINQDNEHLVSRILEVRALCKVGRRQRSAIMRRLDACGDNYRNVPVTINLDKEIGGSSSHLSATASPAHLNDSNLPLAMSSPLIRKTKKRLKKETQAEDSDQGETVKRPNLLRESGMPKRPHNAFFYYSQDKRPKMQKDFPNLSKKEIAGILSARWSQLLTEEKLPFLKLEEERRKEYKIALQKYKGGLS